MKNWPLKQKVITCQECVNMKLELDFALEMGWFIHQVVVNPDTNMWLAILYKVEDQ